MSASSKSFAGECVVTHVVRTGETLDRIAHIYLRESWKPIWLYNSEIEHTVGGDPNSIRPGVSLFIPRSKKGYDHLIKKLESLQEDMDGMADTSVYELDILSNRLKAEKVMFDFAGNIATLLAGLAIREVGVSRLGKLAEGAAGQAKIAARLAANDAASNLVEEYASVRDRLVKSALEAQRRLFESREELTSFTRGKAVEALTKAGDEGARRLMRRDDGEPVTNARDGYKAAMLLWKFAKGAATGAEAVGGILEIGLDRLNRYLTVSNVAELVILLRSGETAAGTIESRKKMVRATATGMIDFWQTRIERYEVERDELYG